MRVYQWLMMLIVLAFMYVYRIHVGHSMQSAAFGEEAGFESQLETPPQPERITSTEHRPRAHRDQRSSSLVESPAPRAPGASFVEPTVTAQQSMHFFMLLTKGVATLNERTPLVSIESACKHHPNAVFHIYTLNSSLVSFDPALQDVIRQKGCNINIMSFSPNTFFRDSPLEIWIEEQLTWLSKGKYWYSHMTDLFRTVALWRFGGWYLDTDVLVLRPLKALSNCAGFENDQTLTLNNAISHFDAHHPFLENVMSTIRDSYKRNKWSSAGPGAITLAFRSWPKALKNCQHASCVNAFEAQYFFPLNWSHKLFEVTVTSEEAHAATRGSYALHLWNKRTKGKSVVRGSIFAQLYQENCLVCTLHRKGKRI